MLQAGSQALTCGVLEDNSLLIPFHLYSTWVSIGEWGGPLGIDPKALRVQSRSCLSCLHPHLSLHSFVGFGWLCLLVWSRAFLYSGPWSLLYCLWSDTVVAVWPHPALLSTSVNLMSLGAHIHTSRAPPYLFSCIWFNRLDTVSLRLIHAVGNCFFLNGTITCHHSEGNRSGVSENDHTIQSSLVKQTILLRQELNRQVHPQCVQLGFYF